MTIYPTLIHIDNDFHDSHNNYFPAITLCTDIKDSCVGQTSDRMFQRFRAKDVLKDIYILQSNESINLAPDQALIFKLVTFQPNGSWWIYIHHSYDTASGYGWDAIEVLPRKQYKISYILNSYHLLAKPYATQCIHYSSQTQYMSRKDCVRRCRRTVSEQSCGSAIVGHEVDVHRGEPTARFTNTCVRQLDFKPICERMCPHMDCHKHYFTPKVLGSKRIGADHTVVELTVPSEPETIVWRADSLEISSKYLPSNQPSVQSTTKCRSRALNVLIGGSFSTLTTSLDDHSIDGK
ncbi:unnamed protein product [Medioppia subpectinata]|uniref:Uncharacterized protein n=1 Tax=Medioppia subpectinata TaxID=1979941 RepID=A0A7R9Q397_9ACAR|nr:unnamed protein product [Medioppia subpectinata]CAG2110316.1 unnamed protein product [Medioppia subpectinata]